VPEFLFTLNWIPKKTRTVDLRTSRTQTTAVESLGFDKPMPKYTHWTPVVRNYKVSSALWLASFSWWNQYFDHRSKMILCCATCRTLEMRTMIPLTT